MSFFLSPGNKPYFLSFSSTVKSINLIIVLEQQHNLNNHCIDSWKETDLNFQNKMV